MSIFEPIKKYTFPIDEGAVFQTNSKERVQRGEHALQKALAEVIADRQFDNLSIAEVIGALEMMKLHVWEQVPREKT